MNEHPEQEATETETQAATEYVRTSTPDDDADDVDTDDVDTDDVDDRAITLEFGEPDPR